MKMEKIDISQKNGFLTSVKSYGQLVRSIMDFEIIINNYRTFLRLVFQVSENISSEDSANITDALTFSNIVFLKDNKGRIIKNALKKDSDELFLVNAAEALKRRFGRRGELRKYRRTPFEEASIAKRIIMIDGPVKQAHEKAEQTLKDFINYITTQKTTLESEIDILADRHKELKTKLKTDNETLRKKINAEKNSDITSLTFIVSTYEKNISEEIREFTKNANQKIQEINKIIQTFTSGISKQEETVNKAADSFNTILSEQYQAHLTALNNIRTYLSGIIEWLNTQITGGILSKEGGLYPIINNMFTDTITDIDNKKFVDYLNTKIKEIKEQAGRMEKDLANKNLSLDNTRNNLFKIYGNVFNTIETWECNIFKQTEIGDLSAVYHKTAIDNFLTTLQSIILSLKELTEIPAKEYLTNLSDDDWRLLSKKEKPQLQLEHPVNALKVLKPEWAELKTLFNRVQIYNSTIELGILKKYNIELKDFNGRLLELITHYSSMKLENAGHAEALIKYYTEIAQKNTEQTEKIESEIKLALEDAYKKHEEDMNRLLAAEKERTEAIEKLKLFYEKIKDVAEKVQTDAALRTNLGLSGIDFLSEVQAPLFKIFDEEKDIPENAGKLRDIIDKQDSIELKRWFGFDKKIILDNLQKLL